MIAPICILFIATQQPNCNHSQFNSIAPLTQSEFHSVLEQSGWPIELYDEATVVAYCESNLIPGISNGTNLGLFQINFYYDSGDNQELFSGWARWVRENYGTIGNPFDPVFNAYVARLIYERNNGWNHNWAHCGGLVN